MTDEPQAPDEPAWAEIRRRYETTSESLQQIAQDAKLAPVQLSQRAKRWGWLLRTQRKITASIPRKARAESTTGTIRRLKDLIYGRLRHLEGQLGEIGTQISTLSSERDIRAMNTLGAHP